MKPFILVILLNMGHVWAADVSRTSLRLDPITVPTKEIRMVGTGLGKIGRGSRSMPWIIDGKSIFHLEPLLSGGIINQFRQVDYANNKVIDRGLIRCYPAGEDRSLDTDNDSLPRPVGRPSDGQIWMTATLKPRLGYPGKETQNAVARLDLNTGKCDGFILRDSRINLEARTELIGVRKFKGGLALLVISSEMIPIVYIMDPELNVIREVVLPAKFPAYNGSFDVSGDDIVVSQPSSGVWHIRGTEVSKLGRSPADHDYTYGISLSDRLLVVDVYSAFWLTHLDSGKSILIRPDFHGRPFAGSLVFTLNKMLFTMSFVSNNDEDTLVYLESDLSSVIQQVSY